jgi:hypothetical protein
MSIEVEIAAIAERLEANADPRILEIASALRQVLAQNEKVQDKATEMFCDVCGCRPTGYVCPKCGFYSRGLLRT